MTVKVLDAHTHVWDPRALDYPWLAGAGPLQGPHRPGDLDDGGGQVTEWIFVEADAAAPHAAAEARWVDGLDWPGLVAIVAHVDLGAPDPDRRLAELADLPRLRGIRHLLQGEPDALPWLHGLGEGLAAVAARGLTFDACVRWRQLPALADVLAPLPDAPVVLDHLGKPPVDEGIASVSGRSWLASMQRLARLPGLSVKLSGLPAEASAVDALARNAPDFLRATLDLFGADRCLFGTDWPVSGESAGGVSTARWIDLVARAAEGHDLAAVFRGTALRVYGIQR